MIRPSTCLALLSSMATLTFGAPLPSAQAITNNPTDVVLRADFPQGNAQTVVGVIQFYSLNGTTKVHVDVTGLPKNSGMFAYHIHEKPVGADKSCAGTGTHFNPFGASSECEALGDDSLCEVGDLSGRHGLINTTFFEFTYHDPYLSLDPSSQQYVGDKAINIHLENGDWLACATIKPYRKGKGLTDSPIHLALPPWIDFVHPTTMREVVEMVIDLTESTLWRLLFVVVGSGFYMPQLFAIGLILIFVVFFIGLLQVIYTKITYVPPAQATIQPANDEEQNQR